MDYNQSMKRETLFQRISNMKIDRRFPDKDSFSDLNLDCRQFCIKEVLRWLGEEDLIKVFINPLSCYHFKLSIRTNEPTLQRGWRLNTQNFESSMEIQEVIQQMFNKFGYALLFYKAYNFPHSTYYQKYDIMHWALVLDCCEETITIMDDSGTDNYFRNTIATFTWDQFISPWNSQKDFGGAAYLTKEDLSQKWEEEFAVISRQTVENMTEKGQANFKKFIDDIKELPIEEIREMLEKIEFELHYYRRQRELWKIAFSKNIVSNNKFLIILQNSLINLCKQLSLVMGVVMKWKRQPNKDYRDKLVSLLNGVYQQEKILIKEIGEFLKNEYFKGSIQINS
ncbi:hypothetical protein [Cytobacillus oceanisediminis]|uniref:hypothetical protein n=1 Tax=Cytobacillus oceanisediminis TaxID=665099 RepID=UPI001C24C526|nr:hypothetical protein [Cytobacillus oceanisediminis]MBU8772066.1 hypothetical protein [Cytobacillus oceanisediminis]